MRVFSGLLVLCLLFNIVGCARATDTSMCDGVVLLDPGHGGFDGGTVAEDGTVEKHLNLAIAQCIRDMLYVCGVPVAMTRETDEGLEDASAESIRAKKSSDMRRRLVLYNEASLVISIHQNHFSVPKYSGTQLFYSNNHSDSALLAQSVRNSVIDWVQPLNTREIKATTDGIFLLYHTITPALLVECGFLSNPQEREKLKTPAYQQQLSFAIVAGYWDFRLKN